MYSFVSADGEVCVRLSTQGRQDFHDRHGGGEVFQHGRVMKEYVLLPVALLKRSDDLLPLLDSSLDYVLSLRPKETRPA
jgi:hypothetical protein